MKKLILFVAIVSSMIGLGSCDDSSSQSESHENTASDLPLSSYSEDDDNDMAVADPTSYEACDVCGGTGMILMPDGNYYPCYKCNSEGFNQYSNISYSDYNGRSSAEIQRDMDVCSDNIRSLEEIIEYNQANDMGYVQNVSIRNEINAQREWLSDLQSEYASAEY